jgi:hypothetical protein
MRKSPNGDEEGGNASAQHNKEPACQTVYEHDRGYNQPHSTQQAAPTDSRIALDALTI